MYEADRLKKLPLYLFTIIDESKAKARARGMDLIDLGMGNPDRPTPRHIVQKLIEGVNDPANHRYSRPDNPVETEMRKAVAKWYMGRFGVTLDPATEVLPLIGSKEGIVHLAMAVMNPGDIAIVPTPTYTVHMDSVIIAEGEVYSVPLKPEKGYRLDLNDIDEKAGRRAKIIYVSYPHNPTSAVVDLGFFEKLVQWAKDKEIIICSDLAYSDIVFNGYKAPSLMQVKGGKEKGIEFHTLSKSYNMAGWRIGFVVGNADVLRVLAKLKSYVDFGIFGGVQHAAAAALTRSQDCVLRTVATYEKRRNVFVPGLNKAGWKIDMPMSTFYVWARIPEKFRHMKSLEFSAYLLEKTGVVSAPGTGFGQEGEGFVRFAMVEPERRLKIAVDRIAKLLVE